MAKLSVGEAQHPVSLSELAELRPDFDRRDAAHGIANINNQLRQAARSGEGMPSAEHRFADIRARDDVQQQFAKAGFQVSTRSEIEPVFSGSNVRRTFFFLKVSFSWDK